MTTETVFLAAAVGAVVGLLGTLGGIILFVWACGR